MVEAATARDHGSEADAIEADGSDVGGSDAEAGQARWYLVQSRPMQAARAAENLARQGYSVFYPMIQEQRVRRGRRVSVESALFPNYLFIRLRRWVDNWYPLRSTRGVLRLVSFGDEPLPVPEAIVDGIRERLESRVAHALLEPGEAVDIVEGPFLGVDAIFQAHKDEDRVLLLIEMINRQARVSLPISAVRKRA